MSTAIPLKTLYNSVMCLSYPCHKLCVRSLGMRSQLFRELRSRSGKLRKAGCKTKISAAL